MSKHRQHVDTEPPAVYGSAAHLDQVVAVTGEHERVEISMTPAAAVELARVLVQYGSAIRQDKAPAPAPSQRYDPDLWHDIGMALNATVMRASTGQPRSSRYVAPRAPTESGRRRNGTAPLVIVGTDR